MTAEVSPHREAPVAEGGRADERHPPRTDLLGLLRIELRAGPLAYLVPLLLVLFGWLDPASPLWVWAAPVVAASAVGYGIYKAFRWWKD